MAVARRSDSLEALRRARLERVALRRQLCPISSDSVHCRGTVSRSDANADGAACCVEVRGSPFGTRSRSCPGDVLSRICSQPVPYGEQAVHQASGWPQGRLTSRLLRDIAWYSS